MSGGSEGRTQFGPGGRGHGCGSGSSYQGGRGQGNVERRLYKTRPDNKFITLQNGQQVESHNSFNFSGHLLIQMKQQDIKMLKKERQEYKAQRVGKKCTIQNLQQENDNLRSASGSQSNRPPEDVLVGHHTSVIQVTYGTMTGGRNEQQTRKKK